MFIIKFNTSQCGGLGDRIVGIAHLMNIHKCFFGNTNIKILWDYNVDKFFKDENIIYDNQVNCENINMISHSQSFKKYTEILKTCDKNFFSNEKNYIFSLNTNVSIHLYENKNFQLNNYNDDIISIYEKMYKDYFIPKDIIIENVNKIIKITNKKIIGLQFRTGDLEMWEQLNDNGVIKKYGNNVHNIRKNKYYELLKTLYNKLNNKYGNDYILYGTTDSIISYNYMEEIFKDKLIISNKSIFHLDLNESKNIENDLLKLFSEQYLMSQKTNELIISDFSNFGIIMGLTCIHNNIYNLEYEKLTKKDICGNKKSVPIDYK